MFGGGILVSPLLALGGGGAVAMGAVVAGGAIAALLATALLARPVRLATDRAAV
jgi:DHA1 family bicyclomycin/chloramphenicol resistance-like MFS transporter